VKQTPISIPPIPSFLKHVAGVLEGEDGEKMKAMEAIFITCQALCKAGCNHNHFEEKII
jgi:hypothetical protein